MWETDVQNIPKTRMLLSAAGCHNSPAEFQVFRDWHVFIVVFVVFLDGKDDVVRCMMHLFGWGVGGGNLHTMMFFN